MCGIAGKIWFDGERPAAADVVSAMAGAMLHRGPDDAGLHVDGPAALGHRRLSIVDPSPAGRQPMTLQDGALAMVVNGEIYNHRDLRAGLEAQGHRFTSSSDSEVLLPLYLQYWESEGPRFVNRLEGMYAFAIWDGRHRRLVAARDRAGQKPLAYCATERGLSFASELGALRHDPDLDRTPDDGALADFLAFRCVPHPRSAWRGAAKLPPAHVLVAEDGRVTTTRTWCLAPGPERSAVPSLDEAADEVAERLQRAVTRRLMADVPLGALLSGGVDSAAVVAMMSRAGANPVRTFTIGFAESDYDETAGARKVARLFDTRHHEQLVAPDAVSVVERLVRHHGEPFADASSIPTLLVSELAAQHVKVVLTGDGGDEAFGGYDRHRALLLAQRLDGAFSRALVSWGAGLAQGLGGGGQRSLGSRLARFARALEAPPRRRNHLWRLAGSTARLAALLTADGARRLGAPSSYGPRGSGPLPINEALLLDFEAYLPDDVLVKVDIASMAASIEARSPFLDREVLEYAASLPADLKVTARVGKRVLRHALRRLLPPDVLSAPKRGFGVPLDAWMRGPLLPHLREVLLSRTAAQRGLFRPGAVEHLIADHADGKLDAHEQLFTLLVLERWFLSESAPP